MKIFVLFGHRKEKYDGEYAPEALACMDEVGYDENPGYLCDEYDKMKNSGEFAALEIIPIVFSSNVLMNYLYPPKPPIQARIEEK